MIEAMACGTPVIAWKRGSVPEVLQEGVTGFLCQSVPGAVRAVKRLPSIDRARCRQVFEQRFTAERMARDYVAVYEKLINASRRKTGSRRSRRAPAVAAC
jgi:glycosyltransferase involved in cell wall biosynthesis